MKIKQNYLKVGLVLAALTLPALAYPAMAKDQVPFKGAEVGETTAGGFDFPFATILDSSEGEATRALAAAELARIEKDAAADFDAKKAQYEAQAREIYLIDRETYRVPETVRISDIAITVKERGDDAALARALEARGRLVGGADFAAVAPVQVLER